MSTKKTITFEELLNTPLTQKEVDIIHKAAAKVKKKKDKKDDPDSPALTKEQLAEFKPLKDANPELYAQLHPEWYKIKKTGIHIKIDNDVLSWFKAQGKGYQTKMNAVLRKYAFGCKSVD